MSEAEEKNMDKINELIRDISRGAAFSSDAMAQFVELQSEVDAQESTIKYLRKERETDRDKIGDLNSNTRTLEGILEDRTNELEGWRARENEFKDREDNCLKNELAAYYSEKRVEDHQHMVGLIFRNAEIRRTTIGSELYHQPGNPEVKDEYGNVRTYHKEPGFEAGEVKKDEIEKQE